MLSISDVRHQRTCSGYNRREFLRVGSLALGGLTLSDLLKLQALAQTGSSNSLIRKKSVVFLFLQGGPPQHETFDPKLDAPDSIRGDGGDVQTKLSGVHFSKYFPKMAAMADRLSVVRSFASNNGGHTYESIMAGGFAGKVSMSALYGRLAGTTHPDNGMPSSILVLPEAVKEGLKLKGNFETGALPSLTNPGSLGSQYEAFNPVGGSELRKAMELRITQDQFNDRRSLLTQFDTLRRDLDNSGRLDRADRFQQQAFEVITRGVKDAFDLSKEDPKTIAKYDTSPMFKMEDWTKYVNMNRTSNQLGKQLLLARRLIENGCGFVTVSDCGWDLHADGNSAKAMSAMEVLGRQVDHAVSAFLDDLKEKGMQDEVLLVVTGEMGRTPRINKNGGREHWGELTPLVLAGGGLKMGQVIGRSDKEGGRPAMNPYKPVNLMATVLNHLFDVPQLRLRTDLPREVKAVIEDAEPIRELV